MLWVLIPKKKKKEDKILKVINKDHPKLIQNPKGSLMDAIPNKGREKRESNRNIASQKTFFIK